MRYVCGPHAAVAGPDAFGRAGPADSCHVDALREAEEKRSRYRKHVHQVRARPSQAAITDAARLTEAVRWYAARDRSCGGGLATYGRTLYTAGRMDLAKDTTHERRVITGSPSGVHAAETPALYKRREAHQLDRRYVVAGGMAVAGYLQTGLNQQFTQFAPAPCRR